MLNGRDHGHDRGTCGGGPAEVLHRSLTHSENLVFCSISPLQEFFIPETHTHVRAHTPDKNDSMSSSIPISL